jgi:hypothetical protein
MALPTLTKCETRCRPVLASFNGKYEKIIADHPDVKDIDLVRASMAKIGSLRVNGNGAKSKQRTELKPTGTPYKFMTVQVQRKEMRDSLQQCNKECGQEDTSQVEQNKHRKRDKTSEDECCPEKQKRAPPAYNNPRPVTTNNFLAPLRALSMQNAETGSGGNCTKTSGTNESPGEGRPCPSVLTSEVNLISLLRELKRAITGEFFRSLEPEPG